MLSHVKTVSFECENVEKVELLLNTSEYGLRNGEDLLILLYTGLKAVASAKMYC